MSIEHDQSTRKQMRAGITGENVLRPLDEFIVETKMSDADFPVGQKFKEVAERNAVPIALILGDPNHPLYEMTKSIMDRLESGEISLS